MYWFFLQIKLLLMTMSIVFLSPIPVAQNFFFFFLELTHLLAVMWTVPFVNDGDYRLTVTACSMACILYLGIFSSSVYDDAANYSDVFVYIHMLQLLLALLAQMKPLVDFLFAMFEAAMEASDLRDSVNELIAEEDEPEEEEPSAAMMAFKRSKNKMKMSALMNGGLLGGSPKKNAVQPEPSLKLEE
jgi:hypothetical protein